MRQTYEEIKKRVYQETSSMTIPEKMDAYALDQYLRYEIEVRHNEANKCNLCLNERLKDFKHQLIAYYYGR